MKKFIALVFSVVFICMAHTALADEAPAIYIDYEEAVFTEDSGIPYENESFRTMVPVRKPMEMLGVNVSWDGAAESVILQKDSKVLTVKVDSPVIKVNDGTVINSDTAATKINSRVYLPIRAVAEAFGGYVLWNEQLNSVYILTADYLSFRDMFVYDGELSKYVDTVVVSAFYTGDMTEDEFKKYWSSLTDEQIDIYFKAIATDKQALNPEHEILINFYYHSSTDDTRDPYLGNVSSYSYETRRYNPFKDKEINQLNQ